MSHPEFFDHVPHLVLIDPLAQFLGASDTGRIEFTYLDAVKLAGHSCPTVASAYWMTNLALKALYSEQIPERGAILVEFRDAHESKVTGVLANVVSMLTGASGDGGFKGLGGRFERRHRLSFNADIPLEIRFRRSDTHRHVDVAAHLHHVPAAPEMPALMQRCMNGTATPDEQGQFGRLWQERVRKILMEHREDPEVFVLRCTH
jgi:formylmethanofuran dehydrogenase subunit E